MPSMNDRNSIREAALKSLRSTLEWIGDEVRYLEAEKERFTRACYPVDQIDFSKWFSDADIAAMRARQSPYFRYKAKTGYV